MYSASLPGVIQTSSGDRKIPVVATKGTASWIDEEGAYTESDDSFGQVSIGAYKLGTMIKVSEELLNDSVFDLESYISREFAAVSAPRRRKPSLPGMAPASPWASWQPAAAQRPASLPHLPPRLPPMN